MLSDVCEDQQQTNKHRSCPVAWAVRFAKKKTRRLDQPGKTGYDNLKHIIPEGCRFVNVQRGTCGGDSRRRR